MLDNNQYILGLLKELQKIPYLSSKNLYVILDYFLNLNNNQIDDFLNSIVNLKNNIIQCTICFMWKDKDKLCSFCFNPKRDQNIICVVEKWRDLIALEKTGGYKGAYHILQGLLSPIDGITPDKLTISYLISRIENAKDNNIEIIFAFNQIPEADATSSYIANQIKKIDKNNRIKISYIARGIPIGGSIENMDRLTVYKAIYERRTFN
jgi:recombination protein RecR